MFAETDTGSFRGYAARFLNLDRQNDIILPGAFAKSLPAYLDEGGIVLADHENKTSSVIGRLVDATEDRDGLLVEARFSATKAAQDIRRMIVEKTLRKMSIAFYPEVSKVVRYTEKQVRDVWKSYGYEPTPRENELLRSKRGANVISDVSEILEVTVTPIPANSKADILSVKSQDSETPETPVSVAPSIDLAALVARIKIADRIMGGR